MIGIPLQRRTPVPLSGSESTLGSRPAEGGLIIGLAGVPGRKACGQQPELEYRVNSARHVEEDAGAGAGAAEDLQHSPDQPGPLVHAE